MFACVCFLVFLREGSGSVRFLFTNNIEVSVFLRNFGLLRRSFAS